ncbi:MAG: pyridoxamine 5'-phosphate oxidase family protein [Gemmatimonadaceae bacterium]
MSTDEIAGSPGFRDLSESEMRRLLEENEVGRMAFSFHDRVDIRPLSFKYADGWIFGRTSPGDKLLTIEHNRWVAFAVDRLSGPFDWESVVVHGTFHQLHPDGSPDDRRLYQRGLEVVRAVSGPAFTPLDPVPFRTEMFGISINSMTGRACYQTRSADVVE